MVKKVKSYKDLEIWQLARELIKKVYKLLETFPKEEKYGIVSQTKDSVVSIAGNTAESYGRFHYKDKIKFIYNSRGSLFETESHLLISKTLNFVNKNIGLFVSENNGIESYNRTGGLNNGIQSIAQKASAMNLET